MPQVGVGASTNGPAVDVNGKEISTSKADEDDDDAFANFGLFLLLMGLGGLGAVVLFILLKAKIDA